MRAIGFPGRGFPGRYGDFRIGFLGYGAAHFSMFWLKLPCVAPSYTCPEPCSSLQKAHDVHQMSGVQPFISSLLHVNSVHSNWYREQ